MITVFFYLSNVTAGGETGFPQARDELVGDGDEDQDQDQAHAQAEAQQRAQGTEGPGAEEPASGSCKGLRVKPRKNKVIVFYSMLPNGDLDERSLHQGCPVRSGTKLAANFW